MDVKQGSLIKEVQDSQTNTSWIPTTPGKPGLLTLPSISKNGQENQQDQFDRSESQTKQAAPRGTKSAVYGDGIKMYSNFSSDDVDMWSNASFGDLLAMAHAGGSMPAANANDGRTYSVKSSSEPRSTSQKAGGFSIFSSFPFNLSSPPRMTDAISSSNISFQFEPVTPDLIKSKGQASSASKLGIDATTVARGIQANEDTLKRSEANELHLNKEQSVLVLGQSELQENHKPDNEDKQDTELNNTSQQKQRRRKHRPKVVIEGKPKRTPKPRREKQPGPGETKTEKRKYVRRNKAGTPAATSVEEVSNTICHEGKPPCSKTTPTAKRKYVRYKLVTKRTGKPSEEGSGGKIGPTKVSRPTKCCKSCRRSLNFEFESQASNENSSYRPSTTLDLHVNQTRSAAQSAHLGQIIEPTTQETGAGTTCDTTCDITCSPNQELRNNFSQPEMQYPGPPTPDKFALNHDRFMVGNKNESTRGNCGIFFSDLAHDKQSSILQMTPKSPNSSICSTDARLLHGKGLKRQHSYRTDKAQFYNINARGVYFNSMQAYQAIFPANEADIYSNLGMYHAASYKKKRTEIGQSSATSYSKPSTSEIIQVTPSRCNISGSPGNTSATNSANNRMQNSDFMPTLVETERLRKRSNGTTRVRDLASLHQIYKHFQTSTSKEATDCGFGARYETSNLPNACMEAPVTNTRAAIKTKKQSKRSILVSSSASNMHTQQQSTTNARGPMPTITQRGMSPVDEITVHLQHLDLNRESSQNQDKHRIITYHTKFQGESALVLYQRDGSIVPFDSPFARKRKTRPRVDVDDETDRVWKLLLQDINNEGIDGTDEDKAKWWEEERRVFSSRADSFIARMHLVQGDRRFSPWKGSVLDSVVGVFLTQNVSDHLSSSAFMSLAAQFPLKSKSNSQKHEERTGIIIEEPEVCAPDPDVTIRWREDQPNEPNHGQDSSSNTDSNGEKAAVNSNESNENSTHCTKSAEHSVVLQSDSSREGLDLYPESTVNCFQDQRELDDLSSSPSSVVSSQNSAVVQSTETTASIDFYGSTSFTKLLEMAGTSVAQGTRCDEHLQGEQSGSLTELGHPSLYAKMMTEFYCSCSYHQNELVRETVKGAEVNVEQYFQVKDRTCYEAATFSETIVDGKERASIVIDPCNSEQRAVESNWKNVTDHADSTVGTVNGNPSKANIARPGKEKQNIDWDSLRLQAQANGKKRERSANTMDSLDWEAVRCANVNEIAHTIRERGMNNKLAERIKDFLNRLVRDHGSTDLEWLRDVPPDKAKEYLLSFRGLGLKSVECVRLLTLHHLAFPVDTNVGRIAVRLGWVPLQPLPESLQLHLLELYPILESIQQYLWPRLCKLDQKTLYELHYQMITFGKVFCTKSKPNCNACPMRGECRHFASAFASARLALPGPEEKSIVRENIAANENPGRNFTPLPLPLLPTNQQPMEHQKLINSAPIIEEPTTPEPIVEVPATPEQEQIQASEIDIEDAYFEDPSEIPLIELNMAEFTQNVKKYVENNMELHQVEMSKALVALTSGAASIPVPKLKNISRLRTEHHVYELPDSHPLLEGLDRREPDDPCPYLLSIWTPGETANSIQPPEKQCNSQEFGNLCDNETCSACNSARETHSQTVRGTILIPCRTAMRGSFPLNGTYFQVNEVFADHESSLIPINVPRDWLWNLPRRTVYFGTSIPTIFKGLTTESIQHCFWRGFVCVRGFDRKTRAPRPLIARFHFPASKLIKTKGKTGEGHGVAK